MEKDKRSGDKLPLPPTELESVLKAALEVEERLRGRMPHKDEVQVVIDKDFISIPTTRYEELVRAEAELDTVLRAYQSLKICEVANVLQAVFGREEEGDHA